MTQTNKISVQERMRMKALDAFDEVEFQIDKYLENGKNTFSMYKYLQQLEYSGKVVAYMKGLTNDLTLELKNAEGDDQLDEGYDFFTAAQKKKFIKWLDKIEEDIQKFCDEYKPVRKPRKPQTPEQMVKKLPYLKQWESYKSIEPVEIIRAKGLYTYNTSSKKFTAFEGYGLKVKGSKIIDFDKCSEKTLTDSKLLDRLVKGGNIIAKGFIDEIPRSKLKDGNPLITKNTLLLKVIK